MTEYLAKKVGRSLFASHAAVLEPRDPQYEITTDPKTGKQTRKKRDVPPGLSKKEERILRKIRKRANRLDKGFSICGFRFGWTAIIGLVPVLGDVVDASLSYILVIRPARKCELPPLLVERMLLNQAVATTIGLVPVVGDLLMAVWKVNSRNAALFEDFLIARGKANLEPTTIGATVTAGETSRLLDKSKKPGYIDGKTGERAGKTSGLDITSDPQAGPSTLVSNNVVGNGMVSVDPNLVVPSKSVETSPSRGWFSRRKGGKNT
ncbi:hypothetical protein CROQUDRAFT_657471 [Cronartium quercuum f. sp. fusiforme G11]|uniref:Uncharacterized protein n=1 Tax=Cronartium quercuum f. sp. fusiforme G11 TaxID=708437 RepID=A0A9P6TBI9_9BASI|nr:hypothetical protein CROQUDRAFT_657471 [Cronartium quercuum f. sp. fusiforme G11]